MNHRRRPADEVAEVVREIGVIPRQKRFIAVVGVVAERHLAQQKYLKASTPNTFVYDCGRTTLPSDLDILASFISHQPWPTICFGNRQSGRHQKCRPVHGVKADDLLSHQVNIRRPVLLEALRSSGNPTAVM